MYKYIASSLIRFAAVVSGSRLFRNMEVIKKELSLSKEEILQRRDDRLKGLLHMITSHVPYYMNIDLQKENISLSDFPIITKAEIVNRSSDFLSVDSKGLIACETSGSSGLRTKVYLSKKELEFIRSIQLIWWEWAGYKIGDRILQTGITKRGFYKRIKDLLFRTTYIQAYTINKNEQLKAQKMLSKKGRLFIVSYASALDNVLPTSPEKLLAKISGCISLGDKLFEKTKRNFKDTFGAKVYETYGTGEGLMLAAQWDLNYMYILDPYFIVEILDERGNQCSDGEVGRVIVTSLLHKSMPLIRYDTGDMAIRLPQKELPRNANLELGVFKKIIGRDMDVIKLQSGGIVTVHTFTGYFEYIEEIRQFQIINHQDLFSIDINYVPTKEPLDDRRISEIIADLLARIKEPIGIRMNSVKSVRVSPSGKPQIIIRK